MTKLKKLMKTRLKVIIGCGYVAAVGLLMGQIHDDMVAQAGVQRAIDGCESRYMESMQSESFKNTSKEYQELIKRGYEGCSK